MRSRGFTLVEILVALAIASVGVLVLAKMQIISTKGTGYNKETSAATALAQKTVEECRAATFGTVPAGCNKNHDGMTTTCEMDISGNIPYRLNEITVRVAWGNPQNQIALSTVVVER